MIKYSAGRGVGTGRQARLRCVWTNVRAGSSPVLGTKIDRKYLKIYNCLHLKIAL
jgi:hypothetical protein